MEDKRMKELREMVWYACLFFGGVILLGMMMASCASRKVVVMPTETTEVRTDTVCVVKERLVRDSVFVYRDRGVYVKDSVVPVLDSARRVVATSHYYVERIRESDSEYRQRQEAAMDSLRRMVETAKATSVTVPVTQKSRWGWMVVVVIAGLVLAWYRYRE